MVCFIVGPNGRSAVARKIITRTDRQKRYPLARPLEFIFIAEIATVHEVARLFIGWIILRDERAGREKGGLRQNSERNPYESIVVRF